MNEQGAPKKKSAKQVLEEIKDLYYRKNYDEALRLCTMLVKKFPNNEDLKGLYRRIQARQEKIQEQRSPEPIAPPHPAAGDRPTPSLESTMFYTQKVEEMIDGSPQSQAAELGLVDEGSGQDQEEEEVFERHQATDENSVETIIQQGVTLYEVQDYHGAMLAWKKALELDPGNQIASDYIQNVEVLLGEETPEPSVNKEHDAAAQDGTPPDKDKLLTIYNDGLSLYKERRFEEALAKWNYILRYFPGHKETEECVRKTQAAIEKENEYKGLLDDAEREFRAGHFMEAERKVLHLLIKAPHLESAKKLKEAIEDRKRQINEIRSLEIEEESTQHVSSATDEEITRYFTPEAEGKPKAPVKKVVKITKPRIKKKKKPMSKWVWIGLLAVILLGAGGAVGFMIYQKRGLDLRADEPLSITIAQGEAWDSPRQRVEDCMDMAYDFAAEGDNLFAYYAFKEASEVATPRLASLMGESDPGIVVKDEILTLQRAKDTADREIAAAPAKIVPREVDMRDLQKAQEAFVAGEYEDCINTMVAALTNEPDDASMRKDLSRAYTDVALERIQSGRLDEAFAMMKRAVVLDPHQQALWRHVRVIQLFYDGKIEQTDKDQWFFFFS